MKTNALIVARFQEDLDWITDFINEFDVLIYNKGTGKQGIKLRNEGREAHTYLYHILHNYDALHDVCVFTQGNPFDHVPDKPRQKDSKHPFFELLKSIPRDRFYGFDCLQTVAHVSANNFLRYGARIFDENESSIIYSMLQRIKPMKPDHVYRLTVSHFAIFSVPKTEILKYSKEFYSELLELSVSEPFGPYALEMLWMAMFDDSALK